MAKKSLSDIWVITLLLNIIVPLLLWVLDVMWLYKLGAIVVCVVISIFIIAFWERTTNLKWWKKLGYSVFIIALLIAMSFKPIQKQYFKDNPPKPPDSNSILARMQENAGLIEGGRYDKNGQLIGNDATAHVTGTETKTPTATRKSKLEVSQRNSFYVGSADDRTKISLLFRNLSDRPTSIVDIYIREKNGGVIRSIGEPDGIKTPIKIQPWDIETISFRVERPEEERMSDILVIDMEDNRIIIPKQRGKSWYK